MADQGKWFKLWCSTLNDPGLKNLDLEDYGRWAKLGALIKEQGRDGKIRFAPPHRGLLELFRLPTLEAALQVLKRFPNCIVGERETTVTTVTHSTVTLEIEYINWLKYQGDYSNDRVRKFRDKKRHAVTAQEEKRRDVEETRREESINTLAQAPKPTRQPASHFQKPTPQEVTAYAASIGFKIDGEKFCAHYEASGWKRGRGTPIVDWKACVRTWKGNNFDASTVMPAPSTGIKLRPGEDPWATRDEESINA